MIPFDYLVYNYPIDSVKAMLSLLLTFNAKRIEADVILQLLNKVEEKEELFLYDVREVIYKYHLKNVLDLSSKVLV